MTEKVCSNCKWMTRGEKLDFNCLNPINDFLYDYFNSSSGDVIRDLRRASVTYPTNTCDEFTKIKPPSSK